MFYFDVGARAVSNDVDAALVPLILNQRLTHTFVLPLDVNSALYEVQLTHKHQIRTQYVQDQRKCDAGVKCSTGED